MFQKHDYTLDFVWVNVVLAFQSVEVSGIRVFGPVECLSTETFQAKQRMQHTFATAPFFCHFKDCLTHFYQGGEFSPFIYVLHLPIDYDVVNVNLKCYLCIVDSFFK